MDNIPSISRREKIRKRIGYIRKIISNISTPKKIPGSFAKSLLAAQAVEFIKSSSGDQNVFKLFKYLYYKYDELEWIDYDTHSFLADEYEAANIDKILALKLLLRTNRYFENPYAFESVTLAFNDMPILVDIPQNIFPNQLAYSVLVADIFRDYEMSEDVEVYIISQLVDDNYCVMLYPLDIEGPFVPKEVVAITKEIDEFLKAGDDKPVLSEAGEIQLEMYNDLLDLVHERLKMEVGDVS